VLGSIEIRRGDRRFQATGESPSSVFGIDVWSISPYNEDMKLVLQTQLLPDPTAAARLRETVERFNEAATWLAGVAFERKMSRTFELHKITYRELRERFGLPADMACRCLAQVCDAYKRDKSIRPKFRKHAAVPYSMGKNIGFKGPDRVSISTLNGRVVVPFLMGKYQADRFTLKKGQSDLVLRKDGKWFLIVTVDLPDTAPIPATDFIGVDLGVTNIAVDSDGTVYQAKAVEAKRVAYDSRRRAIGKKTKGASRRTRRACHKAIVRMERKESRYRRDVNHQLSKQLVAKAKDTGRGIALEDLSGIRDGQQFRRQQRAKMGSWAFHQLRVFVEYKARLAGVFTVAVDPRNTSRTCSECGHCAKDNRKSQAEFKCLACGHESLADLNAALNIRARAVVNPPMAAETPLENKRLVQATSRRL
jgi:putative transposase